MSGGDGRETYAFSKTSPTRSPEVKVQELLVETSVENTPNYSDSPRIHTWFDLDRLVTDRRLSNLRNEDCDLNPPPTITNRHHPVTAHLHELTSRNIW